jgi:Domain of unknown function (DUF4167)
VLTDVIRLAKNKTDISESMRQPQQNKRMRGRGRKSSNSGNRVLESNGPDVKVRGSASHIAEKYVTLARDAQVSGDRIVAENYLQHAEHYFRIVAATQSQPQQGQAQQGQAQQGHGSQPKGEHGNGEDVTESAEQTSNVQPAEGGQKKADPPKTRGRRRRRPEVNLGADQAEPVLPKSKSGEPKSEESAVEAAVSAEPSSHNGADDEASTQVASVDSDKPETVEKPVAEEAVEVIPAVPEDKADAKPSADSDETVEVA